MNTDNELVIPLSKTKIVLIAFGAMVFVALGNWLIIIAGGNPRFSSDFITVVGVVAVAFFGLVFLFASKKLLDKSPGLVINSDGIVDNSSGVAAGLIPWKEITKLSVTTVQSQRFLTVHVHNPESYLDRGNWLKRIANKANYKLYGSPVQISANGLKTNFDELLEIIEQQFKKYGNS